ncbi:MAG: rRNA maturation RNase YbeY [Desulfovibrio sp.]|uniref:rRNA maturation RNase YbeY n=1 Tax=Desulfovibrio sp. TaxID=885 RepID=UPI00135DA17F|nr:rRNA maturation RNase YbeY [Desulfovibrio sp.]MTJ92654.1 rRNA maturation RNase YbeY [Desulfovibrio sp.]
MQLSPPIRSRETVRLFSRYSAAAWLLPLDRRELVAALAAMLDVCGEAQVPCAPPAVELHLVDDATIGAANLRCLGCTGPTNVLSFPGGCDCPGTLLLSLDTLRRECLLYGQEPAEHALRLLAHGMAHLCGLDHGEEMDAVSQIFMDAAIEAVA